MWILLVVAHIGGYNIPVIAVQDLYSKPQCQAVLNAIQEKVSDSNMKYSCIYIEDLD